MAGHKEASQTIGRLCMSERVQQYWRQANMEGRPCRADFSMRQL